MGGAVSSGESNDDLIDNLKDADYIKTPLVEDVFRAVDRAFYFTRPYKKNAYKDVAWKDHNLHLSAPCIYSEVMENLQLKGGMSFLNIGSGTGYLSTMAGLILGRNGINHGIEVHSEVVDYARNRLNAFLSSAAAVDLYEFCEPRFIAGNCMNVSKSTPNRYDRIYCGAACPENDLQVITDLLKVGGICIVPVNESLVLIQRTSDTEVEKKTLLPVSFATLVSSPENSDKKQSNIVPLPEWGPASLSELCRSEIRQILRKTLNSKPKKEDVVAKKFKKKIHDRRRANRLLVVQRRRNSRTTEGGTNGFVAFAYSMGENSSEEETSEARQRPPPPATACTSSSIREANDNVTMCSGSNVNNDKLTSPDSGTESEQGNGRSNLVKNDESAEPESSDILMETATSDGNGDAVDTSAQKSIPLKVNSTVLENKHIANGISGDVVGAAGSSIAASGSSSSSTTRTRTPTTETILKRIREIIQTRQMEREAMRANAGEREQRLREDVEQALREPGGDEEFQDAVNNDDDEVENECVWTSADSSTSSSSSSSSSSDDDSDDYQYAEPIIISRRRPRSNNADHDSTNDSSAHNGVPIDYSVTGRVARTNHNNDNSDDSDANVMKDSENIEEAASEEPIVFQPVSLEMASKINELPLPPPLKKFLNYQRDL